MQVDLGNALDTVSVHGVSREASDRLDDRVTATHDRVERGRTTGEHDYESLNLPNTTDPAAIRDAVSWFGDPSVVITVGIGGNVLGATTLIDAPESDANVYYLDNIDPEVVERLLDSLDSTLTVVNVVLRFGTAAEALANFLVVREATADASVDWTDRTFVTTGKEGDPHDLADKHDLPSLPVPDDVLGRFLVLSTAGLAVVALCGYGIEAVLEDAATQEARLSDSLSDSLAYAYGVVSYTLIERGMRQNAMVPYAESLETFPEWFAQLWAEPSGKDGLGQTPPWVLDATDRHSQLQPHRIDSRDKLATFVRATEHEDVAVSETDLNGLVHLDGSSLGDLLDAEFEATEASPTAVSHSSVRIEPDRVDEYGFDELLYAMEATYALYDGFASMDMFVQPVVEWGKRAAHGLLGGGDFEGVNAVEEKSWLIVE